LDKHISLGRHVFFRGHLTLESSCIWVNRVESLDQSFSTTGVWRVGWLFVKLFEKYTKVQTVCYEYFQYLRVGMYVSCMKLYMRKQRLKRTGLDTESTANFNLINTFE